MKKMLMLVASVAMAMALTGCGCSKSSDEEQGKKATADLGSPKGVAEDFVKAIIRKDGDKALACAYLPENMPKVIIKNIKERVDELGKSDKINDDKLEAKAVSEIITVPAESSGYKIVNGKKFTGETATVAVQFVKGKDKKTNGMQIELAKVDGSWKVILDKPYPGYEGAGTKCDVKGGFDTEGDEDSDRKTQGNVDNHRDIRMTSTPHANVVTGKTSYVEAVKKPYADEPSVKVDSVKADSVKVDRAEEYERLCREFASLLKRKGQNIPEEAIEEEVEKFKKYSRARQEEELEKAVEQLREMRRSADAPKKAEDVKKPAAAW